MTTKTVSRVDQLTDEQRVAMAGHAQKWIDLGWSTEPADWSLFEDAIERCYKHAGIPWHGNVIRVSSPLVMSFAAPIAAYVLTLRKALGSNRDAVDGAVGDAVGGAVRGAVRGAVDGAVRGAVRGAVDGAVGDAVRDAVRGAVRGAVGGAVRDAVDGADLHKQVERAIWDTIGRSYYYRLWGNQWTYWQSTNSFYREVCHLDLPDNLWERSIAYEDTAKAAGWSWPHREFVMVCDRPSELHVEQIGPAGWNSHRLHCDTGPAIAWRDGYALHFWHGTRVPASLIETGWTVEQILREDNSEVRRCAIERMGWPEFIEQAGLTQVGDTVDDPGNPGYTLALYDLPEQIFDERVRILLCTNATVERDGTRRRFGLTVPATATDPIAAAAWTFDVPAHVYRRLARAC